MAVQAKEPISEAKSSGALRDSRRTALPFVAPDEDVVLKPLIQKPRPYSQSNYHLVFLHRFPSQGFGDFSPPADDFSPIDRFFSSSLRGFSLIESLVFPPHFLIEFRRYFHQSNTHGFLFSLPLGLGSFVPPMPWSQTLTRSSELVSKREGNCNILKSCDQSRDGSNQIETISDHYWFRIPRLI